MDPQVRTEAKEVKKKSVDKVREEEKLAGHQSSIALRKRNQRLARGHGQNFANGASMQR